MTSYFTDSKCISNEVAVHSVLCRTTNPLVLVELRNTAMAGHSISPFKFSLLTEIAMLLTLFIISEKCISKTEYIYYSTELH